MALLKVLIGMVLDANVLHNLSIEELVDANIICGAVTELVTMEKIVIVAP